jgi:hypothetical protein
MNGKKNAVKPTKKEENSGTKNLVKHKRKPGQKDEELKDSMKLVVKQ